MNKKTKIVLGIVAGIFIFIAALYFSLTFYFQDVFLCGTWINGVYCTGLTVSETNVLLKEKFEQDYIEVQDKSNIRYHIKFSNNYIPCIFIFVTAG